MYLQKVISRKTFFLNSFFWRLEGQGRKEKDPELDPDPLVKCADPYQNVTDPQHCWICILDYGSVSGSRSLRQWLSRRQRQLVGTFTSVFKDNKS
jgi:hypothetical protein